AVLLTGYFGGYGEYAPEFLEREVEVARAMARNASESGRPLFVQTMYWRAPAPTALREAGVPVFGTIEAAVRSLARLVERPAPVEEGVELIVGARRDPRFGPLALVGLGGVYAELLRDVAVGLAPVSEAEADRMLRSLAGAPLLFGARGRPPLDLAAAARAASALAGAAAVYPEIDEFEINSLLVTADGCVVLEAHGVIRPVGTSHGMVETV